MPLSLESWSIYDVAGFVGVVFYLASYALLQVGVIRGRGYVYPALNLVAAALVAYSLLAAFNLYSAIIQGSWIAISLYGMARLYLSSRGLRFSAQEQTMLDQCFPALPRPMARRLLSAGAWQSAAKGEVLLREGELAGQLFYLANGAARASLHGRPLGAVDAGSLVGEMSVLTGDPASATVQFLTPGTYFVVTRAALERAMGRDDVFRALIENALATETRNKLVRANAWPQSA